MSTSPTPPPRSYRGTARACVQFYWDKFLTQFCRHPPLPLVLLFILGLLSGQLGKSFGVPHVVKYEEEGWVGPWKQFWVGFSLTAVALECLFVGFLLQPAPRRDDPDPPKKAPGDGPSPGYYGPFRRYAAALALSLVASLAFLCLLFVGVWLLARYGARAPWDETVAGFSRLFADLAVGWPLVWGGVGCVGAVAGLSVLFRRALDGWHRSAWGTRVDRWLADWWGRAAPGRRPLARGFVLLVVGLVGVMHVLVTRVGTWERLGGWAWWLALLVAGLLALGFAGVLLLVARPQLRGLLEAIAENTRNWEKVPRHSHALALLFTLAALGLFVVLANAPGTASPVPILCALLFGLLAVYGFLAYAVRRSLPVVVLGLAVFGLLGGLNPYKFRFPQMDDYYHPGGAPIDIPEDEMRLLRDARTKHGEPSWKPDELERLREYPLDLKLWAQADAFRQGAFDDAVHKRGAAGVRDGDDKELLALKRRLQQNRVLPGKDLRPGVRMPSAREQKDWLLAVDDLSFPGVYTRPDPREPLVVVAVSGGGLRSAAWTLRVLQHLELAFAEHDLDFPSHVRLIAGASGGMLGAAYYVTTLPAKRPRGPEDRRCRRAQMDEQYDRLTRDALTPLVNQLVFGDVPLLFSPWPAPMDRGKVLEAAWRGHLSAGEPGGRSPLDTTFAKLRQKEADGHCPSLVFSPMLIEDGRRLLVSNLDLRYVVSNDGNLLGATYPQFDGAPGNYSHEALELFRLFPKLKGKLTVGTAVRMSASFPYFTPAVSLPTRPRRRVVDAGYYDNYGVSLAAAWLFSAKHRDWIERHASRVVLVQIRDGIEDEQRRLDDVGAEPSTQFSRALEEFTSPLEGLESGRVGSSSFRNDGQVELLSLYYDERRGRRLDRDAGKPAPFTTVIFEFPGQASLSWYLTRDEKDQIGRLAWEDHDYRLPDGTYLSGARNLNRTCYLLEWWGVSVRCAQ